MDRIKPGGAAQKILLRLAESDKWLTERECLNSIRPGGVSERWGNSYFLVGKGNGHTSSLVKRGLITYTKIGVKGPRFYNITPRGMQALAASLPKPKSATPSPTMNLPITSKEEYDVVYNALDLYCSELVRHSATHKKYDIAAKVLCELSSRNVFLARLCNIHQP